MLRVTSLEQLGVAELSGKWTRPKAYENGHKKVLAFWFDIEGQIKQNSDFQSHFLMSKICQIFTFFFHWRIHKRKPNFLTFKAKKNQRPRIFLYTPSWNWGQAYSSLNSATLSCKLEVTLVNKHGKGF